MALPRIIFNSINLDFPEQLSDFKRPRVRRAGVNTSDGGVSETVRSGIWDELEIAVEMFATASFFDAWEAAWAWISRGKQFSYADDNAKTVNLSISNNESVGATVIELPNTTGIVTGQKYYLTSADFLNRETVTVQSISAGVSVTLTAGIKFAYSAGDGFRDRFFWPKLVTTDDASPMMENPGLTYSLLLHAREDRA
jgi:hypothetical protein